MISIFTMNRKVGYGSQKTYTPIYTSRSLPIFSSRSISAFRLSPNFQKTDGKESSGSQNSNSYRKFSCLVQLNKFENERKFFARNFSSVGERSAAGSSDLLNFLLTLVLGGTLGGLISTFYPDLFKYFAEEKTEDSPIKTEKDSSPDPPNLSTTIQPIQKIGEENVIQTSVKTNDAVTELNDVHTSLAPILEKLASQYQLQHSSLTSQIATLQHQKANLEKELEISQKTIQQSAVSFTMRVEALEESIARFEAELKVLEQEKYRMEEMIAIMENENEHISTEHRKQYQESEALKKELSTTEKDLKQTQDKLQNYQFVSGGLLLFLIWMAISKNSTNT